MASWASIPHPSLPVLVSSKMPGGFNITAARKYLETRWGLGSGRQDGVLLAGLDHGAGSPSWL